jgi:hypothetical protein
MSGAGAWGYTVRTRVGNTLSRMAPGRHMPSIYAGLRELPSSFSLHCLQLLDPPPFPVCFTLPVPIPSHPTICFTSSRTLALRARARAPLLVARHPLLASLARGNSLTTSIRPHHRPRPSNSLRPHRTLRISLVPRCRSLPPPRPPTRIRFSNRHAPR